MHLQRNPFPDSALVEGTEQEKLEAVRRIRDMIKQWMINPPKETVNFKKLIDSSM
jgi:arsenate reductase (thioredoxin)